MNKQGFFSDAEIISVYSREQAINDGFLVDVSGSLECQQNGFLFPVALTRAVWDQFVEVPKGVIGQDMSGRLMDILWILRLNIRSGANGSEILFSLRVRNDNREGVPPLIALKAVCRPGDDGAPCITITRFSQD
jgi:hypothetical protein